MASVDTCLNNLFFNSMQTKTILLLGGFGFIGTNIIKFVDEHQDNDTISHYRFVVFDKFSSHLRGIQFNCISKVYAGDFSDQYILDQIFEENKIDIVIHSLSSVVPLSSSNAVFDIESNLVPTITLLEVMRKHNVKDIVYMSSGGAVYTDNGKQHSESEVGYPRSSYGIVKLAIEKYLFQYKTLYGFKPLILRLSNPFGRFHYSMRQGIINVAIRSCLENIDFVVYGDGEGVKDYIFIDDVCDILFTLMHKGINGEIINVGSSKLWSVNSILSYIKSFNDTFTWSYNTEVQLDTPHFCLDTSKLIDIIGDYNFTDIQEGIKQCYLWCQCQNREGIDK